MSNSPFSSDRRDFLTGKSAVRQIRSGLSATVSRMAPTASHTIRLSQRAMACDFSVILNAGVSKDRVQDASQALDLISDLEQQMSVYRDDSELTQLNRLAAEQPVEVEPKLYSLLREAQRVSDLTERAFDPTARPLLSLWRRCRDQSRIPLQDEIDTCLRIVGMNHVEFDDSRQAVRFARDSVELDLGAIGKGHALDRAAGELESRGLNAWLLHGGHSSVLARGDHNGAGGWPVGIGNPLFTGKRLGTIVLRDAALATSGSNIQYFRHRGKKYGHILDPRTGWPIETMLSVTVIAPTAALADALSTAFYVMGIERATDCCHRLSGVSAILIPFPQSRKLSPLVLGISEEALFLDPEQVTC